MEFVPGVSLAELMREMPGHRVDPHLAAWIMSRVALGLHAAHSLVDDAGEPLMVVHRDVSPQNVLMSYEGRVYIGDFGIAKLLTADNSASKVLKGKFNYMSPEQARSKPLDPRSDIFSLGVVLYELLTGTRPFAAVAPTEILDRVVRFRPESPESLASEVPASIAAVAMRCLDKDPAERYPTAGAVARALREALRATGKAVDELDLTSLLQDRFAERRAELEGQLRTARPGSAREEVEGKDETTTVPSARMEVGRALDEVATVAEPAARKRGLGLRHAAIGLAAMATAAFVLTRPRPEAVELEASSWLPSLSIEPPSAEAAPPAPSASASAPLPARRPPPRPRPAPAPSVDVAGEADKPFDRL
jgi:serine/threonine protein kinase